MLCILQLMSVTEWQEFTWRFCLLQIQSGQTFAIEATMHGVEKDHLRKNMMSSVNLSPKFWMFWLIPEHQMFLLGWVWSLVCCAIWVRDTTHTGKMSKFVKITGGWAGLNGKSQSFFVVGLSGPWNRWVVGTFLYQANVIGTARLMWLTTPSVAR